jgi:hypothetical protein
MQAYSFTDYSLPPEAMIPPDEGEEPDDPRWQHYCEEAATVNRQRILEVVLSDLDGDDSPLMAWIDDALENPHEPGRAKANIVELAKLGQAVLNLIARAVDDQVNMRLSVKG